jgi:hypothetical protein
MAICSRLLKFGRTQNDRVGISFKTQSNNGWGGMPTVTVTELKQM